VNLHAESSAVLAWLPDENSAAAVRQSLAAAEIIVASDLTLIECDRVILRAAALGELTEAEAADRRAQLTAAASHWQILRVAPEIVERARQPFPWRTDSNAGCDSSGVRAHCQDGDRGIDAPQP